MMETKQVPIFFFSGTGNTWWVGNQIAEALNQQAFTAKAISIEQVSADDVNALIDSAVIIGIGYPIYGSDAPVMMQEFLQRLPKQSSPKPLFIYVTQMEWSGDGAYFMHRIAEKKGYQVRWAVEFKMPNNIGMHVFPVPSSPVYEKFLPVLDRAAKRATELAGKISRNQPWIQGKDIVSTCLSWIQRAPWRLVFKWTQRHTWSVDAEKCSHCRRCERLCPVNNIHLDENGLPIWSTDCNVCLRCFNYCPEQAVLVYKKPFNAKRNGGQPFQGPVPAFKPEILVRPKHRHEA